MTRDVKIGLLLGLAFIFMIAFVINGLPSFRGDSNELTNTMLDFPNNQPGLGANERDVINRAGSIEQPFRSYNPLMEEPDIRFKTQLPQGPVVVRSKNPPTFQGSDRVRVIEPRPVNNHKTTVVREPKTVKPKPALPRFYVVTDGDNLAYIAKKFYGDDEGNKRATILRIFEANRNLLNAADEIEVGQKLIIPPLSGPSAAKEKSKRGLASSIFEKVKSIGRERLSLKKSARAKQGKPYIVQEGDSLWRIAAERLGDGGRYTEVVKLNADVLSDEDSLSVGMSLKIPVR